EVASLLGSARQQEEDGKLVEPPGNNAVGWYRKALEQDPGNRAALDALTRIGGAVRDWSIAALERGDEAEAQRYAAQFAELPHSENELIILRNRLKPMREVMPLLAAAAELLKQGRMIGEGDDNALALYRRSEEHTSELQSRENLVCRLLLEKKKKDKKISRLTSLHNAPSRS